MQPSIFGISGLRGIVGRELTPETATRVAAAFGRLASRLRAGDAGEIASEAMTVVIGRDTRPSGSMLSAAAAAGLTSSGCDVVVLGICPTPTVLYHVRKCRPGGGIIITASHNPEQWNGMKFVGPDGLFLSPSETAELKRLSADPPPAETWNRVGNLTCSGSAVEDHVEAICSSPLFSGIPARASRRGLRVGVDAVNGAAARAAVRLLEDLGTTPVALNCRTDHRNLSSGFPRPPEPTADNVTDLSCLVRDQGLDFGVAFDPDGDRASFVDEAGTPLGEELTLCLACRYLLPGLRLPTNYVVTNLSTSRAVEDVCREHSVEVIRTPVGEIAVVLKMKQLDARLGGEGNGGVILPEVNFTRDGLVATACVLGLTADGMRLSDVVSSIPVYRMLKEKVTLARERLDLAFDRLRRAFPEADADMQDGLRLDGPDYWLHVRPSNTEPVVRIIAERRGTEPPTDITDRVKSAIDA